MEKQNKRYAFEDVIGLILDGNEKVKREYDRLITEEIDKKIIEQLKLIKIKTNTKI